MSSEHASETSAGADFVTQKQKIEKKLDEFTSELISKNPERKELDPKDLKATNDLSSILRDNIKKLQSYEGFEDRTIDLSLIETCLALSALATAVSVFAIEDMSYSIKVILIILASIVNFISIFTALWSLADSFDLPIRKIFLNYLGKYSFLLYAIIFWFITSVGITIFLPLL